jgi:hypothetical protein
MGRTRVVTLKLKTNITIISISSERYLPEACGGFLAFSDTPSHLRLCERDTRVCGRTLLHPSRTHLVQGV